jgi:hypothetical protein
MVPESNLDVLSNECKTGNHDFCPGKLEPPSVENCQCKHHQNAPIYVDGMPVSKVTRSLDNQWCTEDPNGSIECT